MSIRRSWNDYGISKKRYRELKELACLPEWEQTVEEIAVNTCPFMWEWMVKSVTQEKAYDMIEFDRQLGRIPCGKSDFYGYRRKFYFKFNKAVKEWKNYK